MDPESVDTQGGGWRLGGESNGLWRIGPGVFGETPNTAGKMPALPIFHGLHGFFDAVFAVKFAKRHPIEDVVAGYSGRMESRPSNHL
jgi:hypothetical protein